MKFMIKTTKLPLLFLFLSCLFLASISSTLGYGLIKVDSKSDLEQCFNQCKQQYGDDQQSLKQLACQEDCVLQEIGKQQGERGGSGQGGDSGREGRNTESPAARREFEQCQQRCQQRERYHKQCQQRCEQQLREREGGEEEGRGGDIWRDQQCRRQCEQREGTAQQRQLCKRTCRQQYEQQTGEEGNDVDPHKRYEQCRKSCQRQAKDPQQQQQCEGHCRKQLQEDQRQQTGDEQSWDEVNTTDQQEKFQKCQRKCQKHKQGRSQSQSQSQKEQMKERECMQKCQQKYREEQQGQKGRDGVQNPESHSQEDNPYYFPAQESESRFRTQEGHLRVTERFSDKSELLRGIDNYRLAILVARPNTFVIPHHCDAESVLSVVRGKGTISLVWQNKRESYNIENGDVIRVPAGTTVYLINQQNDEDLEIAKLLQSVNNPGEFKEYFVAGGQYPQSYFRVFSNSLLEQVLNVPRDQIENIFGKETRGMWQGQRQAIAIKASQEQLRALSKHVSSSKQITDSGDSKGPIKLPSQKPLYFNDFGKLFEANPEEHKQLKDMDVLVDLVEINQGAIMVPHHNSRATIVAMVLEGSGRYEMACPHLSSQEEGEQMEDNHHHISSGTQFKKVSANLSPGDVFVIPAGHPISIVASRNQNLRMLGFGINGRNNKKNFLAGKESMTNQVEREAKELAFNVGGEDMEQIFNKQKLSYFVPQQQSQQQGQQGRDQHLASILDFAGFL